MSADRTETSRDRADRGDDQATAVPRSAELELLREENQRLRAAYARARQAKYRQTARALAVLGVLGFLGGLLLPGAREVLFALGGTGVFAGVLTYYITPEQFVSVDVTESVYAAHAATETGLQTQLGLDQDPVYTPVDADDRIRVFFPQHPEYDLPVDHDPAYPLVANAAAEKRGLLLTPTGGRLLQEVQRTVSGGLASTPGELAVQLGDAVVETFELARSATTDVDTSAGRLSVTLTGPAVQEPGGFDHPATSLLACGLATGLDTPVTLADTTYTTEDDGSALTLTYTWTPDGGSE